MKNPPRLCPKGHAIVGDNVLLTFDKKRNNTYEVCRTCNRVRSAASMRRRRMREAESTLTGASWVDFCRRLKDGCLQCGKAWRARACGPTHAAVAAARK